MRPADARAALLVEIRPAVPLPFRHLPLGGQAALLRPPGRTGGPPGLLHVQGGGHPLSEPLHGQLAVAGLGALVVHHHPQLRAEPVEQPGPLPGPQGRRAADVEAQLQRAGNQPTT